MVCLCCDRRCRNNEGRFVVKTDTARERASNLILNTVYLKCSSCMNKVAHEPTAKMYSNFCTEKNALVKFSPYSKVRFFLGYQAYFQIHHFVQEFFFLFFFPLFFFSADDASYWSQIYSSMFDLLFVPLCRKE